MVEHETGEAVTFEAARDKVLEYAISLETVTSQSRLSAVIDASRKLQLDLRIKSSQRVLADSIQVSAQQEASKRFAIDTAELGALQGTMHARVSAGDWNYTRALTLFNSLLNDIRPWEEQALKLSGAIRHQLTQGLDSVIE